MSFMANAVLCGISYFLRKDAYKLVHGEIKVLTDGGYSL